MVKLRLRRPDLDADGTISVPDAPSLGFKLDREAIRDCTVQAWESDSRAASL